MRKVWIVMYKVGALGGGRKNADALYIGTTSANTGYSKEYDSFADAEKEAKRLAGIAVNGATYFVFEAVAGFQQMAAPVQEVPLK